MKLSLRDSAPSLITGERDLPHHLKGEHEKDKRGAEDSTTRGNLDDYALNEALNVLKGMALQHKPVPAETATEGEKKKG